jgi:hypothetical protein
MVTQPVFIKRQRPTARITTSVSSMGCVSRIGNHGRGTPNDTGIVTVRRPTSISGISLLPAATSKTPHVFGKRLLGAYQMAGGIFLLEGRSVYHE